MSNRGCLIMNYLLKYFLAEKLRINKQETLISNLDNKEKYIAHMRKLRKL